MKTNPKAVTPSKEEMSRLLNPEGSTPDIKSGLTWHDWTGKQIGKPAEKKTGRQLADEQMARVAADANMQPLRERQAAQRAEQIGLQVDSVLLRGHQIMQAYDAGELDWEDYNAAMFANARQLKAVSPESLREFCNVLNDKETDEVVAVYGIDAMEDVEEAELSGNKLWEAVAHVDELESTHSQIAAIESKLEHAASRNMQTFEQGLEALGLGGTSDEEVAYYEGVSDYAAATIGYRPSQIAHENPEQGLALMRDAQDQLAHHARKEAESRFKAEIMASDHGSVDGAIETAADRQAAAMRELSDTIKRASGEASDEIPPYDPDFEVPLSRDEVEDPPMTVAEFKKSFLAPDEKSVAHGYSDDEGDPISEDDALNMVKEAAKAADRGERFVGRYPLGPAT
jgi:hypothetical protein